MLPNATQRKLPNTARKAYAPSKQHTRMQLASTHIAPQKNQQSILMLIIVWNAGHAMLPTRHPLMETQNKQT